MSLSTYTAALQWMWQDTATVYTQQQTVNETTGLTELAWAASLTDLPCKLSFSTLAAAAGDPVAAVSQTVKLFCAVDAEIPAGSRVTVVRAHPSGEQTYSFKCSGLAGKFATHQEIQLEPLEGYA